MTRLSKQLSTYLVIIVLMAGMNCFWTAGSAAAEEIPPAPGTTINVSACNTDRFAGVYADQDGPGVIWRRSNPATGEYNLMYYDGENTVTTPLTALPNTYDAFYVIDGQWVGWSSGSSNVVQLWSRTTDEVQTLSSKGFQSMDMDDGNMAWVERTGGKDCIKFYRQATNETETINIPDNKMVASVHVTGDLLIFKDAISRLYCYDGAQTQLIDTISNDYDADNGQVLYDKTKSSSTDSVYLWDHTTGSKTLVTDTGNYKKNLRLDNGKAVWIDTYYGSLKLYYYDGNNACRIMAPDGLSVLDDNSNIEFHDGLIVWDLYRNSSFIEIMLYNTAIGQMYRVSNNAVSDSDPVVHNGYIGWWSAEGIRLFHYSPPRYTVCLEAIPASGGSVSGDGLYDQNAEVTVRATPGKGFRFVNWKENDVEASTSADYTFNITGDRNLQAYFESSVLNILPAGEGYEFHLRNVIDTTPVTYYGRVYQDGSPYSGSSGNVDINFEQQDWEGSWEYVSVPIIDEQFPVGAYEMRIYSDAGRTVQEFSVPFTIIPMLHITQPGLHDTTSSRDIDITGFISNYGALESIESLQLRLNGEEYQDILSNLDMDNGTFSVPVSLQSGDNSFEVRVQYTCSASSSDGYEIWGEIAYAADECFIATAAYGSKFQPAVSILRNFRDDFLLTTATGQAFVVYYYKHSPKIAAYIATNGALCFIIRVLLSPVIALIYLLYKPWLGMTVLLCVAGLILLCKRSTIFSRN